MKKNKFLENVIITDNFWSRYRKTVAEEVIPYQWNALNDKIPEGVPSHAISNLKIAAGLEEGKYAGEVFQDSDIAKWLETVAYSLNYQQNNELEKQADELINLIGLAQESDGYFNTYYQLEEQDRKWSNLRDNHELYCLGHFIEAAVAYYKVTGKKKLLDIVCKSVELVTTIFGVEEGKIRGYPGHEEIELALLRLYEVTKNQAHLNLASYFINQRGQKPNYFEQEKLQRLTTDTLIWNDDNKINFGLGYEYQQAHLPVREQKTAVGHAVRAVYLYTAMAALAKVTDEAELKSACHILWKDLVHYQMYITGGIGSSVIGESLTSHYDLPNDGMYCETCASVGLAFFAKQMLNLEQHSEYGDVLEKVLYNGTISGMNLAGNRFFYVNPLEVNGYQEGRKDQEHVQTERQKWLKVACCPPNLARLIASLDQYIYSEQGEIFYTHLYIGSELTIGSESNKILIKQETNFPWGGEVKFSLNLAQPQEKTFAFRIPKWCRKFELKINDVEKKIAVAQSGYLFISDSWQDGDEISLNLAMPVEKMLSNVNIKMNVNKLVLQRGPIVYCLEEADNGRNLSNIIINRSAKFNAHFENKLEGVVILEGEGKRLINETTELYTQNTPEFEACLVKAVPYYAWGNRSKGEMRVWLNSNLSR